MVKIVNSQLGIITDSVNSFFDNIFGRAQEYENLLISSGGIAFLRMIITGMFLGFLISAVVMMYNKRVLGKAVRELVELGAVGSAPAQPGKAASFVFSATFLTVSCGPFSSPPSSCIFSPRLHVALHSDPGC